MAQERILLSLSELETSPVFDQRSAEQNIAMMQEWLEHLKSSIKTGLFPVYRSTWEVNNLFPILKQTAQALFDNLRLLAPEGSSQAWGEAWAMISGYTYWDFWKRHSRSETIKRKPFTNIFPHSFFLDHSHSTSWPESSLVDSIWWDILCTADLAASWEALLEKPTPLNPALLVLQLYEQGVSRINFYPVSEWEGLKCVAVVDEKMVVDFPLRSPFDGMVACLALGDQNQGDNHIRYVHGSFDSCDRGQPISYTRQSPQLKRIIKFHSEPKDHLPDPEK